MSDTIAAIATGMGDSGIGIIRISGDTALQIVDQIFQPVNKKKTILNMDSYTAAYGKIIYEGEIYDEAVALVMRAPKTYTTEDVVELDCHGGITVLKRVLDLVIRLGARPAEPGEFTKRAFLGFIILYSFSMIFPKTLSISAKTKERRTGQTAGTTL